MVCCERCDIWYHYRCINTDWDLPLNRRQVNDLINYYCYPCRRANPLLKIKYFSSDNFKLTTNQDVNFPTRNQQPRSPFAVPAPTLLREQSTSYNQQRIKGLSGQSRELNQRTRNSIKSIDDLTDRLAQESIAATTITITTPITPTNKATASSSVERPPHSRGDSTETPVSPARSSRSSSWASTNYTISSFSRSRSPISSSPSP